MIRVAACACLALAGCALALAPAQAADRITDAPFATRSEVLAPHAMAATSQPLAKQIAPDVMGFGGPERAHWLVEALKLAFADRARLYADPQFFRTPVAQLLDKGYAAKRLALIDPGRAAQHVEPGMPMGKGGDTIYLATADSDGNMVSLIQSNYYGMGSGMAPEGLDFILHDRGAAFALEPGAPTCTHPASGPFTRSSPRSSPRMGSRG